MKVERSALLKHSNIIAKLFLVCVICIMMAAVLTGLTTVSNSVTIHEDGSAFSRYTIYTELDDILENQNITLGEDDKVEFTGFSDHKADIYITRAFDVPVSADGTTQTVVMTDGTVQEALEKAGVTVSENDLINAPLTEQVTRGTQITVNRVVFTQDQAMSEIPYEVIKPEVELASNQKLVTVVAGQNGQLLTTTQTRWIDGVQAETTVVSEEVVAAPINEEQTIVEEVTIGGFRQNVAPGSVPLQLDANGNPVNYSYKVTGKATAYSALGRPTKLRPGDVAMNLSQFPKGTRLYIKTPNGGYVYGYSTVRDTGTAVNNGTVLVDCYFTTYEESVAFGAKTVDVYVLN